MLCSELSTQPLCKGIAVGPSAVAVRCQAHMVICITAYVVNNFYKYKNLLGFDVFHVCTLTLPVSLSKLIAIFVLFLMLMHLSIIVKRDCSRIIGPGRDFLL